MFPANENYCRAGRPFFKNHAQSPSFRLLAHTFVVFGGQSHTETGNIDMVETVKALHARGNIAIQN